MTNPENLPEHVVRQYAEAEALEKQLYGEPAPETQGTTAEPDVVAETTPLSEPVPVVEQKVEPVVEDAYKHKYDVLQGKYNAEVPRLNTQLREANEAYAQLVQRISELEAQSNKQPDQPAVKDNDAETFGEDLTEAIDRRAKQQAQSLVQAELAPMRDYIKQLEAKLGDVGKEVSVSTQDRFATNLAKLVPDYEAVNVEQGFLDWLGEVDPVYGIPRQAGLDNAANSQDVARVAAIFNAYKQVTGKLVKQEHKQSLRNELERQVAPTTNTANSRTQAPQGKIWSAAEYTEALDPRTARRIGAAAAAKLEADAEQAYAEGRVQW